MPKKKYGCLKCGGALPWKKCLKHMHYCCPEETGDPENLRQRCLLNGPHCEVPPHLVAAATAHRPPQPKRFTAPPPPAHPIPDGEPPERNESAIPVVAQPNEDTLYWLSRAVQLGRVSASLPEGTDAQLEAQRQANWAEWKADESVRGVSVYVPYPAGAEGPKENSA